MIVAPTRVAAASGYFAAFGTTPSIGIGATTTRSWLLQHRRSRLRQNGVVKEVELRIGTLTGYTSVVLSIRRWNGATYALVGSSENLLSKLAPDATNRVVLSSPIGGCLEGDYVELSVAGTGGSGSIFVGTATAAGKAKLWTAVTVANPMDWEAQTATDDVYVQVHVYMDEPQFKFIGDSHIVGSVEHRSFIEDRDVSEDHTGTNVLTTMEHQFLMLSGWTYQNMGIGGETAAAMSARFAADALDAQAIVVHSFWNDVRQENPEEPEEVTLVHEQLNQALSTISTLAGERYLFIVEPVPLTSELTSNHLLMDDWIYAARPATTVMGRHWIPHREYTGSPRAGGPVGNRWDWKPGYTNAGGDGLHPSTVGKKVLAQAVWGGVLSVVAPRNIVVNARARMVARGSGRPRRRR